MGYQDDCGKEHYQFTDTFLPPFFFFFNLAMIEEMRVQNALSYLDIFTQERRDKRPIILTSFKEKKKAVPETIDQKMYSSINSAFTVHLLYVRYSENQQ